MYLCEGKEKACTNVMASKISVYQSDSFVMYQCDEKIFFSKCTFVLAHQMGNITVGSPFFNLNFNNIHVDKSKEVKCD